VHALLRHLEQRGFAGAPRFLGVDIAGRDVLSYLTGAVPRDLGEFSTAQCAAAARLLCALHGATAGSPLCGDAEVVCHGDASPCNAVFRDGLPYAFIDFDAAHPGRRRDDLGYAAWLWLNLGDEELSARRQGARLGAFIRAYGAFPLHDAVSAVLDAQAELSERSGAPLEVRAWAASCRAWTEQQRPALEMALASER
jgi:Ser/Thr protein kinase RdoA (MazF antagonist)